MNDGPGLFDGPLVTDVSALGDLRSIVVTESDARFFFRDGILKTSPDQFFSISLHLSRKLESHG
ncbi:MAG: hypothetical protein IAI48_00605 [Candidatus Eremiobacteraeota bacterium]|nr:hypothetical protein [Candidatus Eremiobacteraeota bacterium]